MTCLKSRAFLKKMIIPNSSAFKVAPLQVQVTMPPVLLRYFTKKNQFVLTVQKSKNVECTYRRSTSTPFQGNCTSHGIIFYISLFDKNYIQSEYP
jgi:hypothetical protein